MAQPHHHHQMLGPEAPAVAAATPGATSGPQLPMNAGRPLGSEKDPLGHPLIPKLLNFGTSIYVPIEEDLSAPFTPPATRVARLREILALLDAHSAAVQSNTLDLAARDAARIVQDARRWDDLVVSQGTHQGDVPLGLEDDDLAEMIGNMEAPSDAFRDPYLNVVQTEHFPPIGGRNPREWAVNELFSSLDASAVSLEKYETHIAKIRDQYQQALKRELEREAE
ncbi:hypothetical protein AK830_g11642 [Neonectria ditissima]|uniref:Uncharacterized protein n=1 Tax=Neonectria ditissima TaxID=78410 RepID=A0A0P7ACF6_9HYPO|nr:hypothetical protein AK830_g11642 [Neonectria ditissima]